MKEIVLASASPRRYNLLRQIGLEFKVVPSRINESFDKNIRAEEVAQSLSYDKAMDVARRLSTDALVIGADTIVVTGGSILGKPENKEEAFNMLKSLQGKWHTVITGVTIVNTSGFHYIKGYEKTKVRIKRLSDNEINSYIKTNEPMDKAGSYGIQGIGAVFVERIEGCYFNVVGLPLMQLYSMLKEFGISIL